MSFSIRNQRVHKVVAAGELHDYEDGLLVVCFHFRFSSCDRLNQDYQDIRATTRVRPYRCSMRTGTRRTPL